MPGEYCGCASRIRPFPIAIAALWRTIPHRGHRQPAVAAMAPTSSPLAANQPFSLAFRPKGRDVRSGVADVIPKAPGRHEKMDQSFPTNSALATSKRSASPVAGECVSSEPSPNSARIEEPFPDAIGQPTTLAEGHNEVRLDAGERVGHPDGFAIGEEHQAVLVCQCTQRQDDRARVEPVTSARISGVGTCDLTLKDAYTNALTSRSKLFMAAIPFGRPRLSHPCLDQRQIHAARAEAGQVERHIGETNLAQRGDDLLAQLDRAHDLCRLHFQPGDVP